MDDWQYQERRAASGEDERDPQEDIVDDITTVEPTAPLKLTPLPPQKCGWMSIVVGVVICGTIIGLLAWYMFF